MFTRRIQKPKGLVKRQNDNEIVKNEANQKEEVPIVKKEQNDMEPHNDNFHSLLKEKNEEDLRTRISYVKQYHRLRQHGRGLQTTDDSLHHAHKNFKSFDASSSQDSIVQPQQGLLLDRSFQSQAIQKDEVIDYHLEAYVTEKLNKRLGVDDPKLQQPCAENKKEQNTSLFDEDLGRHLFEIPENLQVEDTSQQEKDKIVWTLGLAEVPLSYNEKLRNIEETEKAKKKAVQTMLATITTETQQPYSNQDPNLLSDKEALETAFGARFQTHRRPHGVSTDAMLLEKFRKRSRY